MTNMVKDFEIRGQLETSCPNCGCIMTIKGEGKHYVWTQEDVDKCNKRAAEFYKAINAKNDKKT